MKHKGSKWAKQVDWVGQLTNPIVKCYKLHNPKSQRSSDVHLRAVARPILPSPRKPQVFPTKLSPRFRKRSFTWNTKKNSDESLKATWPMKNVYCIVQICFLLLFNFLFVFSVSDSNHENCKHGTVKILSPSSPPRHQCAHHLWPDLLVGRGRAQC